MSYLSLEFGRVGVVGVEKRTDEVGHIRIGIFPLVIVEAVEFWPHFREGLQGTSLLLHDIIDPMKAVVQKKLTSPDRFRVPAHGPEHPHPIESIHS